MTKVLYFVTDVATAHRGDKTAKLDGTAAWWAARLLSEARGTDTTGTFQHTVLPVAGPTNGVEITNSNVGSVVADEWLTEPLSADFTIAGTITANLWSLETDMNGNAAINFVVDKVDGATGALTRIVTSARTTELGTSSAVANFTATPTSTACKRGDRLRVRVFADDAGTMGALGAVNFFYNRSTAGVAGDSWIQFTENLTFEPAGDPGVQDQTSSLGNVGLAAATGRTQVAQSFLATSGLTAVLPTIAINGAPTDNLIAEIQTDNAGVPSGTVVGTVATVAGSSLTTTLTQYTWGCNIALSAGTRYWVVFRRSGAIDAANYYIFRAGTPAPAGWTQFCSWNGSIWQPEGVSNNWLTLRLVSNSTYYLTASAIGAAVNPGSADERVASQTRPVTSAISMTATTVLGPTAPIQITLGGSVVQEWYTGQLNAFSLGGKAKFVVWATESAAAANASLRAEIAICNSDGTSPVVWGTACAEAIVNFGGIGELSASAYNAHNVWVSGDDTAVALNQRLRFRIYIDDTGDGAMAAGGTVTISTGGPTANALGDTFVILPQAVTESGPAVRPISGGNISAVSTVTGDIIGLIRISPSANVAAISTVAGNVRVLRKIAPSANIAAISTMGGSVARVHPVAIPAQNIGATSTVSGSVRKLDVITPAPISAVSTVSGSVRALKRVTPAAISAQSTVGGSVRALRRVIPTTISAVSTVSGTNIIAFRRVSGQISAVSTMAGSISKISGGPKPITPGGISAVSTMSGTVTKGPVKAVAGAISASSTVTGSVVKRFLVKPASITAQSTVAGTVRPLRAVFPAAISATSTVAGNVRVLRAVRPTTSIAATSSVSGSVTAGAGKPVVPAGISATSSVSGAIGIGRRVSPTNIAASSAVGGMVTRLARISGAISAATTVSGSVRVLRAVRPASISALSTVAGTVTAAKRVSPASITAVSGVSGAVRPLRAVIPAAITAVSTVSGRIAKVFRVVTGQINAVSSMNGSISTHPVKIITGLGINAVSTVSGSLRVGRKIPGAAISATSTVSGSIKFVRVAGAAITAISTVAGSVRRARAIASANIQATSSMSGSLRRLIAFTGAISATSTVSGSLVGAKKIVGANISATTTVSGKLAMKRVLTGQISATTTVTGRITRKFRLPSANIVVFSTMGGKITRAFPLRFGNISAISQVSGSIISTSAIFGEGDNNSLVSASDGTAVLFSAYPVPQIVSARSKTPRLSNGMDAATLVSANGESTTLNSVTKV